MRRRPYSVVLFDEIEKAHPDVFNILLQVLEDGRLTDSFGRTVDFRNTVLIMTSNIGARQIEKGTTLGFQKPNEEVTYASMKDKVMGELKKTFNPEFLNRIDEVIVFHQLSKEELKSIINLLMKNVYARLKNKKVKLELSEDAIEFLIEKGYDPTFGARPLKRAIQKFIEDPLATEILTGKFPECGTIAIKKGNNKLHFEPIEILQPVSAT